MGVLPSTSSPLTCGGEVHHMAVALERHQLVDVHRAELGHPAHVVAGEVDEHDVLGHLLGVLLQLAGEAAVVVVGATAAAGTGDGAADHRAAEHLHHRFGGLNRRW